MIYHWTTMENAKKILANGLNAGSFVAEFPDTWCGEVCLEINWEVYFGEYWEALAHKRISPLNIRVHRIGTELERKFLPYNNDKCKHFEYVLGYCTYGDGD